MNEKDLKDFINDGNKKNYWNIHEREQKYFIPQLIQTFSVPEKKGLDIVRLRTILAQLCYESRLNKHKIGEPQHDSIIEHAIREIEYFCSPQGTVKVPSVEDIVDIIFKVEEETSGHYDTTDLAQAIHSTLKPYEVKVPEKKPSGAICSWLNSARECDAYIDGYNTAISDIIKLNGMDK
jgi:hypothetical protein